MSTKSDILLSEILSMSPNERARIAHCLISSLDEPTAEYVDEEWIQLAEKRLSELENGGIKPISWETLKKKLKANHAES